MAKQVEDLMSPLSEHAVVDENATILDALRALAESQAKIPAGRQPHRAILVRSRRREIVGRLHHFAALWLWGVLGDWLWFGFPTV